MRIYLIDDDSAILSMLRLLIEEGGLGQGQGGRRLRGGCGLFHHKTHQQRGGCERSVKSQRAFDHAPDDAAGALFDAAFRHTRGKTGANICRECG